MPFTIATFNVKNLLEPNDDGARALLPDKLDNIAAVLREADADVVGLQEIGGVELLQAVLGRLAGCGYGEPVLGTPDRRSIRCAVIARVPLLHSAVRTAESLPFPAFRSGDPAPFGHRIPLRRGIVHVRVAAGLHGQVDVMVVHFKSGHPVPLQDASGADIPPSTPQDRAAGMLRSLVWRTAEALHTRGLVDRELAADPEAHVAVVGDLNDWPSSPALGVLKSEGPGELFDCTSGIEPSARFSIFHRGAPQQLDYVLTTAGLHSRLVAARFLNAALRDHGPFDTAHAETPTRDSDHAALAVRFA